MLRRRFLLAMGASALVMGACEKKRVIANPPPPPQPQPRADCSMGANQVVAGQPTAPMPFHQCPAQREVGGCMDMQLAAFNETETRLARQQNANACCYDRVMSEPCPEPRHYRGRPFRVEATAAPSLADVHERDDWTSAHAMSDLDSAERRLLTDAWLEDARAEHASVAAFSLLSLQLMQLGAPPELIRDAHLAALDEIRHAEQCFALASSYAGEPMGPGPLDIEGTALATTLVALAESTLVDGCFGETSAALEAYEAAELARDAGVRSALEEIAEDEARHAELGWRIVAWAVKTGGDPVRDALARRVATLRAPSQDDAPTGLEQHGRLSARARSAIAQQCIEEVVGPCVEALLG